MLAVAALWMLGAGLIATALVLIAADRLHRRDFQAAALSKLAEWDYPEFGAFIRSQRLNAGPRSWELDDLAAFDVARRALLDYQVLGPGDAPADGDWRRGDAIRYLPPADRADLEAWLLERAYRFCRTSADRPGSPADRRRVLELLDRAVAGRSIGAFAPLRDRLAARVGSPAPRRPRSPRRPGSTSTCWASWPSSSPNPRSRTVGGRTPDSPSSGRCGTTSGS